VRKEKEEGCESSKLILMGEGLLSAFVFVLLPEATIIRMEDKQKYLIEKCKSAPVGFAPLKLHDLAMIVHEDGHLRYSNTEVTTF